jgi:HAD superfamily hydrolase (TIGR01509 family)
MVKQLRRDGFRLAVCSNSIRSSVELMLRGAGLIEDFDFYLSNEDVARPKPDPEMYLKAMQLLGIGAGQTVIVEDAGPGIEAAHRSKAHVCQVSSFDEVEYRRIRSFIDRLSSEESHDVNHHYAT